MSKHTEDGGAGRSLLRWFALLLSLFLSGLLIWRGRDDLDSLTSVSLGTVLSILGLQAVFLGTQSEKLRLILRNHSQREVPVLDWTRIFLLGRLMNSLVMQSGNAYRLVALKQTYGVNYSRYLSSLAAQTWISVLMSLVIATALAFVTPARSILPPGFMGTLMFLTMGVAAAPILAQTLGRSRYLNGRGGRLGSILMGALERVARTLTTRALALRIAAFTFVAFICGVIIIVLAFAASGIDVPLFAAATLLALMQVTNLVMITPGNLGIQELGFAALTGLLGFPAAVGVIASAVVRVSGVVALALTAMAVESAHRLAESHR